jgi:Zinc carboxypeptidase/Immune inhibitor A-like, MAM domain
MFVRTRAWMALAVVALLALAAAGPATAKGHRKLLQPLNQYVISGKVNTDELARAGFDLNEASVSGKKGRFLIVATARQVARLRQRGAKVGTLHGGRARTAAVAAPSPLTNPTHGYDVFRPWSLKPAPCPGTCVTPLKPLKAIYQDLAKANPDVVKREVIGHSRLGQEIVAYKVTRNARDLRDGARPAVLYDATQHAREWISTEVQRRLFTYVVTHKNDREGQNIRGLLNQRELWFVPVDNPDGYDYTFTSAATRLWRKNLRDNNGDGAITNVDGVDMNRNWPEKWNYDLEGASDDPTSEEYHGPSAGSEPEVQGIRGLIRRIRPKFLIDYHSFAQLILYPEGWQVETPSTDTPLMAALAGDDDNPAVAGFDPDVSAELYTTNGDITDDAYHAFGVQAFTVELDGGTGGAVGGTDESDPDAYTPGGFVFQDSEADIQAEFAKNLAFALDLARSAKKPDQPKSHLGNTAPDFVPTTFPVSYGSPQTVEVNAKRRLGNVRVRWQVNDGRIRSADTSEYEGGSRYGEPGVYYHRLRGQVTGTSAGDRVRVWFTAKGGRQSASFTYTARSESSNQVLLMSAEDYTGRSATDSATPYAGPRYLSDLRQALEGAGVGYDVYNVDANGRTGPSELGVLSHYKAVVWYTGDDVIVRGPDQQRPGQSASGATTGTEKLLDDEILATRDFMNDGGKLLVTGQFALEGAWEQQLYNPLGPTPPRPFCPHSTAIGQGALANDPPGQNFNCVAASNDFQQYWLGAYLPIALDPSLPLAEVPPVGDTTFGLNGAGSADNQANLYSFLTTSSILPPAEYPQFKSEQAIKVNGPPAFDPPTGSQYLYSQQGDASYKRLTRTVDLTGKTSGALQFKLSADTEADYDYVFVEAHTVGQDDWTTLPDRNGNTSNDTGAGCPDPDPFWLNENPFLRHYITRNAGPPLSCSPTGTTGAWNAFTGNSAGFQDWDVDLTPYAGNQVEVSITYASDPGTQGLGVFLDDVRVLADGATVAETSFEDDLGGWAVPGSPPGNGTNTNDWERTGSVGFIDGPGVATDHSLLWGFGLEGVAGADTRAKLMGDAMTYLGVSG